MGWSSMWKWWLLTWSSALAETWREPLRILDLRFPPFTNGKHSINSIHSTIQRESDRNILRPPWVVPIRSSSWLPQVVRSSWRTGRFLEGGPWNASPMFFGACHENNAISWHFPWKPLFGTRNRLPKIWHFIISCMEFGPFPSPEILVD